MKIAVIYVYPMVNVRMFYSSAKRFADTYRRSNPSPDRQLHIMANGGRMQPINLNAFNGIAYECHDYDNTGWDIGAFQWAAENIPCDLLICLGTHIHFHQGDWLSWMAESYIRNGPALYGCWCYPMPLHVRTTCFWLPPQLLNAYPNKIGSARASRYDFEHGPNSITRFAQSAGLECLMVTRKGIFPLDQWPDHAPGPDDSLVLDQHTHR